MPSRSSRRHRSRSHSKRHKKSHKKSRKSNDETPPISSTDNSTKQKEEIPDEDNNHSLYKAPLPSVISPTSFYDLLAPKEKETADSNPSDVQITVKRKSRWNDNENEKVVFPFLRTAISTTGLTEEQQQIHLLQVQIQESTRRLKVNDLGIASNPGDRSPSPEPIYDQHGKRQNTREVRARRKIEEERHQLIAKLLVLFPDYKPPTDYRAQQMKYTDKVFLPRDDYPEINFIGLILGPRANTLKMLEKETNTRIAIAGKGSLRDGKMGLIKTFSFAGEDEPLHVHITGSSVEIVAKAVEKIQEIINQIIDAPEGLNDFRKDQLRQLALIKGTLRENEPLMKLKIVTEAEKILTNTILCTVCGGAGHISSDCKFRKNPDGLFINHGNQQEQQKFDCEYKSLLNELDGKKDTNTNNLSLDDQRNLMPGSRSNGPTLAIANGSSSSTGTVKTVGVVSFNSYGSMNVDSNYFPPPSSTSFKTNTNSNPSTKQSNYSNTSFSTTAPRYNNNDLFDGYHLLRRPNQNNNYSSFIEGDSYRAQHIPALIESQRNFSTSPYHSQQQNYPNQQWNPYNTSMYYQNNNTSYRPPLPKEPPPPLPPR